MSTKRPRQEVDTRILPLKVFLILINVPLIKGLLAGWQQLVADLQWFKGLGFLCYVMLCYEFIPLFGGSRKRPAKLFDCVPEGLGWTARHLAKGPSWRLGGRQPHQSGPLQQPGEEEPGWRCLSVQMDQRLLGGVPLSPLRAALKREKGVKNYTCRLG